MFVPGNRRITTGFVVLDTELHLPQHLQAAPDVVTELRLPASQALTPKVIRSRRHAAGADESPSANS